MQNPAFPFKITTFAMTILLVTTLQTSAQDAVPEAISCDDCVALEIETAIEVEEEVAEQSEVTEEGTIEPELFVYPSIAAEVAVEAAEDVEPVMVSIEADTSTPALPEMSVQDEGEVSPVELSIDASVVMDDGGVMAATPTASETVAPIVTSAAFSGNSVAAPAPVAAVNRDRRPHTVRAVKGDACQNRATYIALFCAWQGFARPEK